MKKIITDEKLMELITYIPFNGKVKNVKRKFYSDNTLNKIFVKLTKNKI